MKTLFKVFGIIALLLLIAVVVFGVYRNSYPYLADGAMDAERIAYMAATEKDLTICSKIKTPVLFLNGFDITREDIKALCYQKQAGFMKDKSVCDLVKPYSSDTRGSSHVNSCKDYVDTLVKFPNLKFGPQF
ncbi:MAG: hypothetical protein WC444_02665 [Candidatus Paceibacterota bacterium]